MSGATFHEPDLPVLLVQCANQHKRITRHIDSVCPECGRESVNAYSLPTEMPSAVELLDDDDE
jgi:hypothetical protein